MISFRFAKRNEAPFRRKQRMSFRFAKRLGGRAVERAHYRRISPQRTAYGSAEAPSAYSRAGVRAEYGGAAAETGGFREGLILQGIVSGLILVVALLTCLIKNETTVRLRTGLRQAFEGRTTAEELMVDATRLTDWVLRRETGLETELESPVFAPATGGETQQNAVDVSPADVQNALDMRDAPPASSVDTATDAAPETDLLPQYDASDAYYIDEDVLAELNMSKTQVPEPPVSPEP